MINKIYTCAPLPFQGQKRRFLRDFKEAVMTFDRATTFVDLFGGSGLLAHTVKRIRPDARVIYNDYDDFGARLANIERTNRLLADLRVLAEGYPDGGKLPEAVKRRMLERIDAERRTGFVDYITVSSSLLFSMKYATDFDSLSKGTFYNSIKLVDYNCDGYLDGLEVMKHDYKELFERFRDIPGVVFIIDPPYLSTDAGTYKSYWKLGDYLDVLLLLEDTDYIYFTSDKSHIVELCQWMEKHPSVINTFKEAELREHRTNVNYHATYRDMMFYRKAG